MTGELKAALKVAIQKIYKLDIEPELSRPAEQFGDYSSNVALQVAERLQKDPRQIAQAISGELKSESISKIEVAGPGFINISLTDAALAKSVERATVLPKINAGQEIVVEYSDPNPFKVLHVGHLYTSVVGDAIAKLLEATGANVHRVNFGGDVGLHVAKAMWSILRRLGGEYPEKLTQIAQEKGPEWLSEAYIEGNKAYEDDEEAKTQIAELNKKIYQLHANNDRSSNFAKIYWLSRDWSYKYFKAFYKTIGSHFEKYYPESETVEAGLKVVRENIGKVFEESNGAIVFKGEVHNMHTRVFVNSQGLPTYETKDVGLIFKKWQDYHFDKSIVITGNEIYEYMQVVLKAIEQIAPELAKKTTHLTHGLVKLAGSVKMSSREGNIVKAADVLAAANKANKEINQKENFDVALGAIKYAFLKHRIGADIIYNPQESVSLQGNSGPYLQYAYARARSILAKAAAQPMHQEVNFETDERKLACKISQYPEVVEQATLELLPSHICTYLYELAQTFNRFYEENRVIGSDRETLRLKLTDAYAVVLKHGLSLLNIPAPERL